MNKLAFLICVILLCGCAYTGKNGVRTHIIAGFGVVRVVNTNQVVGDVLNVKAVGIYAGDRSMTLGYVNRTRVDIQTNANVILDLKR